MLKGVVEKKEFGFLVEFSRQSLYFYLAPYAFLGGWVGGECEGYCSVRNMA